MTDKQRPDPTPGHQLVSDIVGVPDGDPSRLWELWAGDGGPRTQARRQVLEGFRFSTHRERAMGQLVALAVRRVLDELATVDPEPEHLGAVLAGADDATLDRWAQDPSQFLEQARRP